MVAYGLNPFPAIRAFDQIRCLMCELSIPLTLCALNAGLCSAEAGFTHFAIEDFAAIRTLEGVEILDPTDEGLSELLADDVGSGIHPPRFVRFDKTIRGRIYDSSELSLARGYSVLGNRAAGTCVVAFGAYLTELYQKLTETGQIRDVKLIDCYKIPFDEAGFIDEIRNCSRIVTVEENAAAGGLGSLVLEILSDHRLILPVKRFALTHGLYDVFTSRAFIRRDQGLTVEDVMADLFSQCGGDR